jgi:hypothetical protein
MTKEEKEAFESLIMALEKMNNGLEKLLKAFEELKEIEKHD